MRDPLKRASLSTLLCVVQCGARWITPTGKLVVRGEEDDLRAPNVWRSYDQAEAEIERRFKRLKRQLKEARDDL
jgi:hypothetical protein